jgi:hypothetical protein
MGNLFKTSDQYTAEEKELARQAIKYLEDHAFCLSVNFDEGDPPSKEVEEFLFGMSGLEDALLDAEATMHETVIEELENEWLAEETEA